MVAFMVITAVLSTFLDNVTTVLLVGPMTDNHSQNAEGEPGTIFNDADSGFQYRRWRAMIGDPPNIMIGSAAGLDFIDFITNTGVWRSSSSQP